MNMNVQVHMHALKRVGSSLKLVLLEVEVAFTEKGISRKFHKCFSIIVNFE